MRASRSWPAGSPRRWATRWWRRCWPMCRKATISPPTEHMRFPGHDLDPRRGLQEHARGGGPQPQAGGLHPHRADRRSWRLSEPAEGGRGRPEPRMGRHAACARTSSTTITARRKPPMCRPCAPRASATRQIGTHAGAADTSLLMAIDPRMVRTDRLDGSQAAATGIAGDPRASTAALGQLGVDLDRRRKLWPPSARRGRRSAERMKTRPFSSLLRLAFGIGVGRLVGDGPDRLRRRRYHDVPGMPPVIDPTNLYSETVAGKLSPARQGRAAAGLRAQPALQHGVGDRSGDACRSSTPSRSAATRSTSCRRGTSSTLWVANNAEGRTDGSLTPIDPLTGKPGAGDRRSTIPTTSIGRPTASTRSSSPRS